MPESSIEPTGVAAKTVYLEQSVYGHMLDSGHGDWRESEIGQVLIDAKANSLAEVWAGPTNVIETTQAADESRRRQLALAILDLIDARRMWHGNVFAAVEEFLSFLTTIIPDSLMYPQYFEYYKQKETQTWLGGLGIIAATGIPYFQPVAAQIARRKLENRLLHARFAADPDGWVARMIDVVENHKVTTDNVFAEIDALSDEQIEAEIESLKERARSLGKEALHRLEKNRKQIARAYGAVQIGTMLQQVFTLPADNLLIFNIRGIVENWPELQRATRCDALPAEIAKLSEEKLTWGVEVRVPVVQHVINATANVETLTPNYIGYQIILRDLQFCINSKDSDKDKHIPSGGLVFDADHAAALAYFDVVVTRDQNFEKSTKTVATAIAKASNGARAPRVAGTVKQLRKAVGMS